MRTNFTDPQTKAIEETMEKLDAPNRAFVVHYALKSLLKALGVKYPMPKKRGRPSTRKEKTDDSTL